MSFLQFLHKDEILIAPSILSADFSDLAKGLKDLEEAGTDMIHIDVMDGHFVPNLTIGAPVVKDCRKITACPFDVHLMISEPLQYVEDFAKAGADIITFHVESNSDPAATIEKIRSLGCEVGISIKPNTPVSAIAEFIPKVDMVLVMSVEPGFGGQSFMPNSLVKVAEIKSIIAETGKNIHIQIDGGVTADNSDEVIEAGVNIIVSGTGVFKHPEGMDTAISKMKTK